MPRTRKDCPLCGKRNLCKLSNHLADIHRLSSEERRVYLKSYCADEEEDYNIMPRSKRPRMDNYNDPSTSSDYRNGDIFDSDDEEQKEHSTEQEKSGSEEESSSEETESGEEDVSNEGSEDETSEEGEYDPWQTLIHEAKRQLLYEFQENVETFKSEGFSDVEAKRHSFSALLPKLAKELENVYVNRLLWISDMKKDPIHKKIMQTRDNLINVDSLDRDEALYCAVEKRKFLLVHLLEERQHFSDNESETNE